MTDHTEMHFETRAIHVGQEPDLSTNVNNDKEVT